MTSCAAAARCGGARGDRLEGHGAGGDVEVFEAGEFLAGFADGFDSGVVGVGVVDQGFLDRFE